MFGVFEDRQSPVLINLETGLRIRPLKENGQAAGLQLLMPNGHELKLRGNFENVARKLNAVDFRGGLSA